MSTSPTYAAPTPLMAGAVVQPARRAETERKLLATDRLALAPVGRIAADSKVVYKIASRREELYAAFGLVYQAYVRAGLCTRHPYRMRVTPYHLLPTTEVFIAVKECEVITTVSLIRDGELGLPLESVYGEQVAEYRKRGYSLAEVSCLADHRQGQKRSVPVVMRLMSLMAQSAKRRGVDQLLIAVHPRHRRFYQCFAAFQPIGEEKPYRTVCDNPAVAMALDLPWAPVDHPRLYAKFFGTPFSDEVLKYRPISDELRCELRLVVEANRVGHPCSELEVLAGC
jgi:hypothetical protein